MNTKVVFCNFGIIGQIDFTKGQEYIRPLWIRNLGPPNGIIRQIEPLRRTQIDHTTRREYTKPLWIRNLGPFRFETRDLLLE